MEFFLNNLKIFFGILNYYMLNMEEGDSEERIFFI